MRKSMVSNAAQVLRPNCPKCHKPDWPRLSVFGEIALRSERIIGSSSWRNHDTTGTAAVVTGVITVLSPFHF
jgi:hypothetical protein